MFMPNVLQEKFEKKPHNIFPYDKKSKLVSKMEKYKLTMSKHPRTDRYKAPVD